MSIAYRTIGGAQVLYLNILNTRRTSMSNLLKMVTVGVVIRKKVYNLRVSEDSARFLESLKQSRYKDDDHEAAYLSYCKRLMNAVLKRKKQIKSEQLMFWDL